MVNDRAKPMAMVNGKPFLEYILEQLEEAGVRKVVLAVGYKYESVIDHFGYRFGKMQIVYTLEETPLGTGGGIVLGLNETKQPNVLIINGDTFFDADLKGMIKHHNVLNADVTIALKDMKNPDRYGTVSIDSLAPILEEEPAKEEERELDEEGDEDEKEEETVKASVELRARRLEQIDPTQIVRFKEKQKGLDRGFINAGVYILKKKLLYDRKMGDKFSFEKDFLEREVNNILISGFIQDAYFVDIGIPADYMRANDDFKKRDSKKS